MAHHAQGTSLSLSARLICYIGPPVVVLLTGLASWKTGLVAPLAFIPTAFFYRKWQEENKKDPSRRGELEPMVWIYAAVPTIGVACVSALQMGVLKLGSMFLFNDGGKRYWVEFTRATVDGLSPIQLAERAKLAQSWQNFAMIGLFSFVAAGLVEETLKYLPVEVGRRRGTEEDRKKRTRAYFDYGMTGSLAFGLLETIGFFYAACESAKQSWGMLVLNVIERIGLGAPAHITGGVISALRATRRDIYGEKMSFLSVIGPSVLLHGIWDFSAFAVCAMEGNVSWIHPTKPLHVAGLLSVVLGVLGVAIWRVKEEFRKLDALEKKRNRE